MFTNPNLEIRRWAASFLSNYKTLLSILWMFAFLSVFIFQRTNFDGLLVFKQVGVRPIPRLRPNVVNITDFGAVGDGVTDNTVAFERSVSEIGKYSEKGGGQINVPSGVWLTCPFNLTSHLTLFLAENAVILGVDDEKKWTLMPPLPSYGYGREHPGSRYGSLIHGQNLKDVVITGHNGTIDGQGETWWKKFRQKLLNHTRGPLIQIMWSADIVVSNITLRNSPFWTLHPYDCKNVTIQNVTILNPLLEAPNTDGIDPDSCEDMLIEDCYISVGDDGIAIKSGWDQYGIAYGRPSKNILIRNLVVRSMVRVEGTEMNELSMLHMGVQPSFSSFISVPSTHMKCRKIRLNVRVGIVIKTDYNEHPYEGYDPKALPIIKDISFTSIYGHGVRVPVRIHGSEEILIKNITFRDISIGISYKKKRIFQCAYVQGRVIGSIFPAPCENLDLYDENGKLVRASTAQNITDIDYNI